MAIVTRYFSTSSNGAADGTTWNDRAALFSAGNWSSIITGFAFNGSDSLVCLIGPGTYSASQSLVSGLFTNPPSATNNLLFHGCDSSGNALAVPDPDWVAAQSAFDDSTLPVISWSSNTAIVNLANLYIRLLKFTPSGNTTNPCIGSSVSVLDWCVVASSSSNASLIVCSAAAAHNCIFTVTGTSFSCISNASFLINCRLGGNSSASSGNRNGWAATTATPRISGCCIYDCPGSGLAPASTSAGYTASFDDNTIVDCGGSGILQPSTASQTAMSRIIRNYIANCTAYGIDLQSQNHSFMFGNRFRDNGSGNIGNSGTHFISENYTTDSDDSTEFVDYSGNDFRLKAGATVWASDYGAGRELDFPAVGNVQNDDTTNGSTGTLTLPSVGQVQSGVTYGAGGTEFTGTLAASGGGLKLAGRGGLAG